MAVGVVRSYSLFLLLLDGVFNFLDTFEERSLKLKVLDHEAKEEKERLEKSLEEVKTMSRQSFLSRENRCIFGDEAFLCVKSTCTCSVILQPCSAVYTIREVTKGLVEWHSATFKKIVLRVYLMQFDKPHNIISLHCS